VNNGYSLDVIFKIINNRILSLSNTLNLKSVSVDNDVSERRKKSFVVLLFIKDFFKLVKSVINKTHFSIGYRIINKLSCFISPYSTKTALTNKTDVVYKIRCNDCETSYVGQTRHKLKTRIKEYK